MRSDSILTRPPDSSPVDQGDIIDDCPVAVIESYDVKGGPPPRHVTEYSRVYVLTQACDLIQRQPRNILVAPVLDAAKLVADGTLKAAEVRGNIRAGRVHGWYFLPKSISLGLSESIVDLRTLYTVRREILDALCQAGKRVAHLESLYREHLAQHFANTYSRIGLPMPYETE
jgi:hypothetical protein